MTLSRNNLVVVLTIMAGGAIGGFLAFGPLVLRSPDDDAAEQVTAAAQAGAGSGVIDAVDVVGNIRQADSTIIAMSGLDVGSAYTIADISRAKRSMLATGQFTDIRVRVEGDVRDGLVTLIWEVEEQERRAQPLFYIDGVRMGISFIESLDPDDIESIEIVKGDAAVALYGEEASVDVILISLKEERH